MNHSVRRAAAWVVAGMYRGYYSTLRLRLTMPDGSRLTPNQHQFGSEVFALCERDVLATAGIVVGRRFAVLVASSRDGDWATAILQALGCCTVRGSSRHEGAAALRGLLEVLRTFPEPLGLVADGPLGPAGRAKPGAAACAIKTRRPLRAIGAAARHALAFPNTWSGIYLPLPFTRVEIVLHEMDTSATPSPDIDVMTGELTRHLARTREHALQLTARARW